jgi:hypothetical protein
MRVLLTAVMLAALSVPARSECLPSADAVWNAHPGSHATWRGRLPGHEGTRCWFARGSTSRHTPSVREAPVADSPRGVVRASVADRPDEKPARSDSQESVPPQAPQPSSRESSSREPSSILMWGKPMRIDPTWEEMFMRRERGSAE